MKVINATKIIFITILAILYSFKMTESYSFSILNEQKDDTLYVLYETEDWNKIVLSKKPTKSYNYERGYPCDWDRKYQVTISNHVHIWFYYFNNLPEWADMTFDYRIVDPVFIKNIDFKNQDWFRTTSKREIYNLFLAKDTIVYLIEKDKIQNGKAIMIRVYPNVHAVE